MQKKIISVTQMINLVQTVLKYFLISPSVCFNRFLIFIQIGLLDSKLCWVLISKKRWQTLCFYRKRENLSLKCSIHVSDRRSALAAGSPVRMEWEKGVTSPNELFSATSGIEVCTSYEPGNGVSEKKWLCTTYLLITGRSWGVE